MTVLTVTQLNTYIKACFEENPVFKTVYINGEISNFKHAYSGHFYFTLKDEAAQLKCVMFASSSSRLRFAPQNGMKVICRGRISCYERDGVYQLYAEDMQPDGLGALNLAFEQLKEKLAAEGLFSAEKKRPIPKYPSKIGVVTSPTGAAVQDITKILSRRFPVAQVYLYPALVQGAGSPEDIVQGIRRFNALGDIDVIIVGRGGGSLEDLWSFNTEQVARAVSGSAVPVISAVGHETDFTICDFASDLRAPTPSAAAELAVPDRYQEMVNVASLKQRLSSLLLGRLDNERLHLDHLTSSRLFTDKYSFLQNQRERLALCSRALHKEYAQLLEQNRLHLLSKINALNALSPLSVLSRGYAVAYQEHKVLKSIKQIDVNKTLTVQLADGTASCTVHGIKEV